MFPGTFVFIIFIVVVLLITTNMVKEVIAALLGAVAVLVFMVQIWPLWAGEFLTYPVFAELLVRWVDFRTIIIILAVMVFTEPIKDSGLFQYISIKAVKWSRGGPAILLAIFCLLAFTLSAVLTQIATIVLIGSLTMIVCEALDFNPVPYLVSEAIVSNVGAVSTQISGIPNILIAGATGYDFNWFLINLLPFALILAGVTMVISFVFFRKTLKALHPTQLEHLLEIDEATMIPNRSIFYRTAFLLVAIIAGFILFSQYAYIVAIIGAVAFLLFGGNTEEILKEVEWSSIFFFIGLFIIVGALEEFGVIDVLAIQIILLTGGNTVTAHVAILWITGLASGVVDNIPITMALIPVVEGLTTIGIPAGTLWIALTLGAELGGCLTPISSTANLLAYRTAAKHNRPIPYFTFLMIGIIMTFIFLGLSTAYVLLRLFLLPLP
ncbi:MAG: SLC13 family permease [Promethearchaeota archaeon]